MKVISLHTSKNSLISLFLCFLFSMPFYSVAQKEAANWIFASDNRLDFNYSPPKSTLCKHLGGSGTSAISDKNGNLLFSATNYGIYTKNCSLMNNGYNNKSNNGWQSCLILPNPGSKIYYYVFNQFYSGLEYSIVDITKNNGLGDVISLGNSLNKSTDGSMTAVKHTNNQSIWLITHGKNNNEFYSYLLTSKGINKPVITKAGRSTQLSYIKVTPDGKYIAQIIAGDNKVYMYKFDTYTGKLSYLFTIRSNDQATHVVFSANNKKLYVSTYNAYVTHNLWQFDLTNFDSNSINNSGWIIHQTTGNDYYRDMQLAINGKIYISILNHSAPYYLTVINKPNDKLCDFVFNGLSLVNYPYFQLPFFLQSYLLIPDFEANGTCFGDVTKFKLTDTTGVDSVWWNFGDTASGKFNTSNQWQPQHSFVDTGLFKVSAYVFHAGKPDTNQREIRISMYPKASLSVISDTNQCINGNAFQFISHSSAPVGGFIIDWDFGDDSLAFNDTVAHSFNFADTFKVKLTALSDYGCTSSDSQYVIVYSPSTDFIINDSTQCLKGNDFLFVADSLHQKQKTTYQWIVEQDTISKQKTRKSYQNYGDYVVTHIATYQDGCTDTVTKNLHVFPMPKADFKVNDSDQCLKWNKFIFTNKSVIDTGKITYIWNFPDSSYDSDIHPVKNFTTDGKFKVQLITTSNNNCIDTFEKQMIVYPSAKANFSINQTPQCLNANNYIFNDLSKLKSGNLNWNWQFGDGDSSFLQSPDHKYLSVGNYTITLIAGTENNCADTIDKQVDVVPSPESNFMANDSSQCFTYNYFVFINQSWVSPGTLSYLWDLGDGTKSTATAINHAYSNTGVYTTQLIATSSNGCADTAKRIILVNPVPKADFSINDSDQCFNEQNFVITNKSAVGSGQLANVWHINNDTFSTIDLLINDLQPETCNLKLVTTTENGCSDSIEKQLAVLASPFAQFVVNDSTQCLDSNSFDFTNLSTISNGTMTYQWIIGSLNLPTFQPSNLQLKYWGKYPVKLIATSDKSCTDTTESSVYVFPNPVSAFIFLNNCHEDTMWFFDKSYSDSGSIQQWYWDFKNGKTSTLKNPFTVFYDSGQKAVTLVSTNDFGCSHDTTRFFKIETHVTAPELERATVENDEFVLVEWNPPKDGIPMTYHLEKSTDSIIWNLISDFDNKTFNYNDLQTKVDLRNYYYRLNVTDSCQFTSPYSNIGKTILLTIDTSQQFPVLTWTPYELWASGVAGYELQVTCCELQVAGSNDFQTVIEIPQSAIINPQSAISQSDSLTKLSSPTYCYRVLATRNGDGLQSVSNVVCTPTPFRLFIPNAFTPNNDGVNDIFLPLGIYILDYNLQIFSRWGELIFESNDIEKGWDGTYKGRVCQVDEYFYQVSANGTGSQRKTVVGTVMLMR